MRTAMTEPRSTSGPVTGLSIALLLSVGVNLLIGGFVLGGMLKDRVSPATPSVGAQQPLPAGAFTGAGAPAIEPQHLFRLLPREARRRVGRAMIGRVAEPRRLMAEARAARAATVTALAAEPFDENALQAAFDRSRAADAALMASVHGLVTEMMAALTPQERAQVHEAIRERMAQRQARRGLAGQDVQ